MAFIKQITAPNGALTQYHKIVKVELFNNNEQLNVQVGSWPSETAFQSGTPAIWNTYITVPSDSLYEATQQKVLLTEEFLTAQIVGEQLTKTPEELQADQWALVKMKRDQLLAASDWRVIKAVDTGTPLPETWKTYRQILRDITTQADPFNIVWPQAPVA
jgi:hypothetical protein